MNHRCLYFLLHCDLVWIPRLFVVEVVAILYLLDLIAFNSNGLLSRVLSAQRQRCRPWMVDEILLQLDKTEMFTIHLQRIGRKHQPFRDQGGMQQTLCAVTRSRTIGQLPEGQGRCLM